MTHKEENFYFSQRAQKYVQASVRWPWRLCRRREKKVLLEELCLTPGSTVLDAGCGAGFYFPALLKKGVRLVGLDQNPAMVQEARRRHDHVLCGDASFFSFDMTFDRILAAGLLEFLPHPEAFFFSAAKHLSPNGRLVILAPPKNLHGKAYQLLHHLQGCPTFLHPLTTYIKQARQNQLTLVSRRPVTPFSSTLTFASMREKRAEGLPF